MWIVSEMIGRAWYLSKGLTLLIFVNLGLVGTNIYFDNYISAVIQGLVLIFTIYMLITLNKSRVRLDALKRGWRDSWYD